MATEAYKNLITFRSKTVTSLLLPHVMFFLLSLWDLLKLLWVVVFFCCCCCLFVCLRSLQWDTFIVSWKYFQLWSFPGGTSGKEPACQCRRHRWHGFNPWVGKIPRRRSWQATPGFLPGESPRTEEPGLLQSIELHSVGHDWTTQALMRVHVGGSHVVSGKDCTCQCRRHKRCRFNHWARKIHRKIKWQPLQYSYLGDPMDTGAW